MHFRKPAFVLTSLCVVLAATCAHAEPVQFPYQATVQADEVEVRAGPSEGRYYATGKLTRGQQITVHRHDNGGWYMITPPQGSFDWIDASVVERQGGDAGVIIAASDSSVRAFVHIGSQLGDDHSLYGRELAAGDRVRILGEQTLQTDLGPTRMLKIEPPAREYRWVKGDFIVAVDPLARREQDLDPYRIPSSQFNSLEYAEIVTVSSSEPAEQTAEAAALETQLGAIDIQYADMMNLEPAQWDLDRLQQEYLALQPQGDEHFQGQVEQRLRAIAARRDIHNDFLQLQQIRDTTTARDQQLLSLQQAPIPQPGALPGFTPMQVELGTPGTIPTDPFSGGLTEGSILEPFPSAAPQVAGFPLTSESVPSDTAGAPAVSAAQLCGAGIIQKLQPLAPGQPSHALMSPDGRLLTLLVADPGVNLDEHEGSSIGIVGQRSFNAQLQADLAVVRQIVPVQLVP